MTVSSSSKVPDAFEVTIVPSPFPIFCIAGRYLLFDVHTVSQVRRKHHICGVLTGNVPQSNQQNIFSGLPLELLPEETRLLVDAGHAYIVDDVAAHEGIHDIDSQDKADYLAALHDRGAAATQAIHDRSTARTAEHFNKTGGKRPPKTRKSQGEDLDATTVEGLFDSTPSQHNGGTKSRQQSAMRITPTTSYPPLRLQKSTVSKVEKCPNSYYLFAHLHSKGYFLAPGLRFGCQYMAYPGDPLRFHSHFLAVGKEWDEPIDLLDIVSGGRLGTGVKKGYLIGGVEEPETGGGMSRDTPTVRTFCFEWAVM